MSDTRLTVKELREQLKLYPDDAVLTVFYDNRFWPFYKSYHVKRHDTVRISSDLNDLLGEKLTEHHNFVLLK